MVCDVPSHFRIADSMHIAYIFPNAICKLIRFMANNFSDAPLVFSSAFSTR